MKFEAGKMLHFNTSTWKSQILPIVSCFLMPAMLRHLKFNRCVKSPQKASRFRILSGARFFHSRNPVVIQFSQVFIHITLTKPCSLKRKACGHERKRKSSQVLRSTLSTCVGSPPKKTTAGFPGVFFRSP